MIDEEEVDVLARIAKRYCEALKEIAELRGESYEVRPGIGGVTDVSSKMRDIARAALMVDDVCNES